MTTEKPILFNAEMVKAILAGQKTQTRRIVNQKKNPHQFLGGKDDDIDDPHDWGFENPDCVGHFITLPEQRSPYGSVGDELWVRETWQVSKPHDIIKPSKLYKDMYNLLLRYKADNPPYSKYHGNFRPSIFMMRWMSRIQLRIVDIRVERLNDMSEGDAWSEGIESWLEDENNHPICNGKKTKFNNTKQAFKALWDSINGKKSPWDSNPWVWVIEFERIKP